MITGCPLIVPFCSLLFAFYCTSRIISRAGVGPLNTAVAKRERRFSSATYPAAGKAAAESTRVLTSQIPRTRSVRPPLSAAVVCCRRGAGADEGADSPPPRPALVEAASRGSRRPVRWPGGGAPPPHHPDGAGVASGAASRPGPGHAAGGPGPGALAWQVRGSSSCDVGGLAHGRETSFTQEPSSCSPHVPDRAPQDPQSRLCSISWQASAAVPVGALRSMSACDACALVWQLHGASMRALATTFGQHVQGISRGARQAHERRYVSVAMEKRLQRLDACFSTLRHVTAEPAANFTQRLSLELGAERMELLRIRVGSLPRRAV